VQVNPERAHSLPRKMPSRHYIVTPQGVGPIYPPPYNFANDVTGFKRHASAFSSPSAVSAPTRFMVQNAGTTTNQRVNWNPGHYMLSNFVLTPSNHGLPGAQTQLDLCGSTANFLGYCLQLSWGAIETALNTYDFSLIDPFFNSLKGYATPKRLVLCVNWGTPFAVSNSVTSGVWIPSYITTNVGTYGAGQDGTHSGYWGVPSGSNLSYAAAVHRSAVMNRFIALVQAIATHYGSDQYFEGVLFLENAGTSSNLQGAADWSWSAFNTQYTNCATAGVAAFPKCNIAVGNNYDSDRPGTAAFMAQVVVASRAGYSGPDLFGATAESVHGVDNGNTWGQNVVKGRAWNGSVWVNGAGPTYKGKIPIMQMIQQPELDGTQFTGIGSPFTPTDLCNSANALGATHLFWTYIASGTGNTAGQITAINANPLTNTGYPY
jgi:hypothetical protein